VPGLLSVLLLFFEGDLPATKQQQTTLARGGLACRFFLLEPQSSVLLLAALVE